MDTTGHNRAQHDTTGHNINTIGHNRAQYNTTTGKNISDSKKNFSGPEKNFIGSKKKFLGCNFGEIWKKNLSLEKNLAVKRFPGPHNDGKR